LRKAQEGVHLPKYAFFNPALNFLFTTFLPY
jgi:hypothetical protein